MAKRKPAKKPDPSSSTAARSTRDDIERPDREAAERQQAAALRSAGRRRVRVAASPAVFTFPLFLRKFTEVGVMASFVGAVMAYNLMAPRRVVETVQRMAVDFNGGDPISGTMGGSGGRDGLVASIFADLDPFLAGGMPVLESKAFVWLGLALVAILAFVASRIWERIGGGAVFPDAPSRVRAPWERRLALGAAVSFLVWALWSISPIGWGPEPPPEALGDGAAAKGGGGYRAFVAWIQVAIAVGLFFVAEDLLRTKRLAYKMIGLVLGLGFVAALAAVLAKVQFPVFAAWWMKWAGTEYRNDVGSVIGHNAALSSFLLAPMALAYTLMVANWARLAPWMRALLVAGLCVGAMALILAQSRAVIPISVVAAGGLLWMLSKRAGLAPGRRFRVAAPLALAAMVATQLVSADWNPLYRQSMPLAERIQHLDPDHLMTETRLRITAASLPVVAANPVRGTGWNTFQYVFPVAQGEYYERNPRSGILPTNRRTFRAHNEYLQTAMETGLVGLGLALAALGVVLRGGRRTLRDSINQRGIAVQCALWVSILAMLAHCFVDFPLRNPATAMMLMVLLALWSAGDRFWVVRVGSGHWGETREPDSGAAPAAPARMKPAVAGAWGVGVAAGLAAITVIGARASDWIVAHTAQTVGRQFGELARPGGRALDIDALDRSEAYFRTANRLQPLMGDVLYDLGRTAGLRALALERMRAEERDPAMRQVRLRQTISTLREGLDVLDRALLETRFHGVHVNRANLHHLLHQLLPGEEGEAHRQAAIREMRAAARMNPGEWTALSTLVGWLIDEGPAAREERVALLGTMHHFHPWHFRREVLQVLRDYNGIFAFGRALDFAREMAEAAPDDPQVKVHLARQLRSADSRLFAEAERLLASVPPDVDPMTQADTRLRIAAARGELRQAIEIASGVQVPPDDELAPIWRDHFRVLDVAMRARLPESAPRGLSPADARVRLAQLDERFPLLISARAMFLYQSLNDLEGALELMRGRIALAERFPGFFLNEADHMAMVVLLTGKHGEAITDLTQRQAAAAAAGEEIPRAEGALREDLLEALPHARDARRAVAANDRQRRVVDDSIRTLTRLLGPE